KKWKNIYLTGIIALIFLIYAFFVDNLSTFNFIFLIFASFRFMKVFEYYHEKLLIKKESLTPQQILLPIGSILLLLVFILIFSTQKSYINLYSIDIQPQWITFFTSTQASPLQWYGRIQFPLFVYLLLSVAIIAAYFQKNKILRTYIFIFFS